MTIIDTNSDTTDDHYFGNYTHFLVEILFFFRQ